MSRTVRWTGVDFMAGLRSEEETPFIRGRQKLFYRDLTPKIRANNISKEEFMGRGDKRTLKGKIFKGSFGKKGRERRIRAPPQKPRPDPGPTDRVRNDGPRLLIRRPCGDGDQRARAGRDSLYRWRPGSQLLQMNAGLFTRGMISLTSRSQEQHVRRTSCLLRYGVLLLSDFIITLLVVGW